MRKSLLRSGASILAAVAVVAGGVAIGAGTSAASCNADDCGPSILFDNGTVENIQVQSSGDSEVVRGNVASYNASFSISGAPDRTLSKIIYRVPADLVFQTFTLEQRTYGGAGTTRETLPTGAVTVDGETGTVTIDAPVGGWQLPQSEAGSVLVHLDYRAPLNVTLGWHPVSMTFEASGIDRSRSFGQGTDVEGTPLEELAGGSLESVFGS